METHLSQEDKMTEQKKWYQSKTVWTNVALLAGAIITALTQEYATAGVLTVASVANITLRVVSKTELVK